jgi:tellurite resistance protein
MNDHLGKRARKLEDLFFAQQDAILIAKHRELKERERTLQELSDVSGIKDRHVLEKLVALGIRPEVLATLAVVPLVEVAWADHKMNAEERRAILEGAKSAGVKRGAVDHALLEQWLEKQPPDELLEAWSHYIAGLVQILSPEERDSLRKELLDRARAVARASGKVLGIGSGISKAEQAVIERMEQAFGVRPSP